MQDFRRTSVFRMLRSMYHMTPLYRARIRKARAARERAEAIRRSAEQALLPRLALGGRIRVLNGPFRGMEYVNQSYCSQILPKVLGSYEEPIQPWIDGIVNARSYDKVVDVGCAEGYYAVGFAMRMPAATIYAFDSDGAAIVEARNVAQLNGVTNIVFDSHCSHHTLERLIDDRTLLMCDIEGAEDELLDPTLAPALAKADIIVESHDCFRPGMTDRLVERFYKSHAITIVVDSGRRDKHYPLPQGCALTPLEIAFAKDEVRKQQMRFLFMKHHVERHEQD